MQCRVARSPCAQARRLLVGISPTAGRRPPQQGADEIVAELGAAGFDVRATSDLTELRDMACKWHEQGDLRAVLACGGDGTAAAVRNLTPLEAPLLLVPMGTENLLGRYISQSPSPAAVRETVERGVTIGLDLGMASRGASDRRYFLTMISAGFDAEVVRRLHDRRRGHITRLTYIQPTLAAIRSYEYPELQLYCAEDLSRRAEADRCRWVFGFNLPLYACGWQFTPDAVGTDGMLDVCTFRQGSLRHGLWYLWHVVRGSHHRLADTRLIRGRTLRIEAVNGAEVAYQLDGDFGGMLPVDVSVLPEELRLLVTSNVARRLGFSVTESP